MTLRDAAEHVQQLPKTEQQADEWQIAVRSLIGAAEGRDFIMHAHVGMMRALNRNVEREFKTGEKKPHWGKRKLARDR